MRRFLVPPIDEKYVHFSPISFHKKCRANMRRMELTCKRKAAYGSIEAAKKSARELMAREVLLGVDVYACEFCRKYHLGHPHVHKPVRFFSEDCSAILRLVAPESRLRARRLVYASYLATKDLLEIIGKQTSNRELLERSFDYAYRVKVQAMIVLNQMKQNPKKQD